MVYLVNLLSISIPQNSVAALRKNIERDHQIVE